MLVPKADLISWYSMYPSYIPAFSTIDINDFHGPTSSTSSFEVLGLRLSGGLLPGLTREWLPAAVFDNRGARKSRLAEKKSVSSRNIPGNVVMICGNWLLVELETK